MCIIKSIINIITERFSFGYKEKQYMKSISKPPRSLSYTRHNQDTFQLDEFELLSSSTTYAISRYLSREPSLN